MSRQNAREEKIHPSVLTRLTAHAQNAGKTINDLLMDMMDERDCKIPQQDKVATSRTVSPDDWSRELRSWAARHPDSPVLADDSRDSVYAGRGE